VIVLDTEDVTLDKFCYWCPPGKKFCDLRDYYNHLYRTDNYDKLYEEIINDFPIVGDKLKKGDFVQDLEKSRGGLINVIIDNLYQDIHQIYGIYGDYCVIKDPYGNDITDDECCKLRGGDKAYLLSAKDYLGKLEESTKGTGEYKYLLGGKSSYNIIPTSDKLCVLDNACPSPTTLPEITALDTRCCVKNGYDYSGVFIRIHDLSNKVINVVNPCTPLLESDKCKNPITQNLSLDFVRNNFENEIFQPERFQITEITSYRNNRDCCGIYQIDNQYDSNSSTRYVEGKDGNNYCLIFRRTDLA
jgi:hypothetical protein